MANFLPKPSPANNHKNKIPNCFPRHMNYLTTLCHSCKRIPRGQWKLRTFLPHVHPPKSLGEFILCCTIDRPDRSGFTMGCSAEILDRKMFVLNIAYHHLCPHARCGEG